MFFFFEPGEENELRINELVYILKSQGDNNKIMGRLNNSEFLTQVQKLLESNNGESSVYITQKRLSLPLELNDMTGDSNSHINDLSSNVIEYEKSFTNNTAQYPVLVRVSTNAKKNQKTKSKLSTVVEIDNLDQFWVDYAHVIKTGFVGLRKKDKKKSKKPGKVSK